MIIGYNTNGFAHHDLVEAMNLLVKMGCGGIGITIDQAALNPFKAHGKEQLNDVKGFLRTHPNVRTVIETGARFLLDPYVKHEPTLVSASAVQRAKRIDFYKYAIDVAAELGSDCVSIWSGINREDAPDLLLDRLADGLDQVCNYATRAGVLIGFEPEPGMVIDTLARFQRLLQWFDHPSLRLTIDIGHLFCQGEVPIHDYLVRWQDRLINVHIEDMKAGVHEHLQFGEGEMNFPPILKTLQEINYTGCVQIELSRHSHNAVEAARFAIQFLQKQLGST